MKKQTKRWKYLEAEEVAPWQDLEMLLKPFYGKQERTVVPPSLSSGSDAAHSRLAAVVLPQPTALSWISSTIAMASRSPAHQSGPKSPP